MSDFSVRLKEERKRLRLNQAQFAMLGGVKKGAQFNYENGSRAPDSDYLMAITAAGVDTYYLLSGVLLIAGLSAEEAELFANFRRLDPRGRARLLGMADGLSIACLIPIVQNNVFRCNVGQQVVGDVVASQSINVGRKKK